ncbi:MAG: hypothetical protein Ta2A_11280 [Treponemataceae bacterium]|nr:MAG: hypothetical protein Ta2A_11280 [Treponemataceae bacterium]
MKEYETVNLYTIYDTAAERSAPVFESVNDATAARSTRQWLKDQLVADYALFWVGTRDISTGRLTAGDPRNVVL